MNESLEAPSKVARLSSFECWGKILAGRPCRCGDYNSRELPHHTSGSVTAPPARERCTPAARAEPPPPPPTQAARAPSIRAFAR